MAQSEQSGGWAARPRNEKGQFIPAPGAPKTPPKDKRLGDLVKLRALAMRLATHLQDMMPPVENRKKKKRRAKTADPATPLQDPTPPKLPQAFERLLGRNDGVIDCFDTLVHLVIRIIDKEKETREPSASPFAFDENDEEELDRRIHAELDRIAERRRSAGDCEQHVEGSAA